MFSHLFDLLVNSVKVLEWMTAKRLTNRTVFAGVDSVFDKWCSSDVVFVLAEDVFVLLK